MAADYEFYVPWPPSVNGYWRTFRNRQIISKRGREYRDHVITHMDLLGLSGELVSDRLNVEVLLQPPTARKYDIDNFCKGIFDGLTYSKFWLDDEQIDRLSIKKGDKAKGGRVWIKVYKLGQ